MRQGCCPARLTACPARPGPWPASPDLRCPAVIDATGPCVPRWSSAHCGIWSWKLVSLQRQQPGPSAVLLRFACWTGSIVVDVSSHRAKARFSSGGASQQWTYAFWKSGRQQCAGFIAGFRRLPQESRFSRLEQDGQVVYEGYVGLPIGHR